MCLHLAHCRDKKDIFITKSAKGKNPSPFTLPFPHFMMQMLLYRNHAMKVSNWNVQRFSHSLTSATNRPHSKQLKTQAFKIIKPIFLIHSLWVLPTLKCDCCFNFILDFTVSHWLDIFDLVNLLFVNPHYVTHLILSFERFKYGYFINGWIMRLPFTSLYLIPVCFILVLLLSFTFFHVTLCFLISALVNV